MCFNFADWPTWICSARKSGECRLWIALIIEMGKKIRDSNYWHVINLRIVLIIVQHEFRFNYIIDRIIE